MDGEAGRSGCVVKVGGSLFDLPDLGRRLGRLLDGLQSRPILLVPGGGPTADVVREFDRLHHLGEEVCHWLALQALTINAHFLSALLPGSFVIEDPALGKLDRVSILDAHAFARADESRDGHLPHCWDVTSDSLAARVARVMGADELILLKSVDVPAGIDWHEAARRGFVDAQFASVLDGAKLVVRAVNLRDSSASPCLP